MFKGFKLCAIRELVNLSVLKEGLKSSVLRPGLKQSVLRQGSSCPCLCKDRVVRVYARIEVVYNQVWIEFLYVQFVLY